MLNVLGGRFRSFKLGRMIGSCRPNPYGIVGSLGSSLRVNFFGSGDAIEDTEDIPVVWVIDNFVEFRIFVSCVVVGWAHWRSVPQRTQQNPPNQSQYWMPH